MDNSLLFQKDQFFPRIQDLKRAALYLLEKIKERETKLKEQNKAGIFSRAQNIFIDKIKA